MLDNNTFKSYYYGSDHDEETICLSQTTKRRGSTQETNIDQFFDLAPKKRVKKCSSTVGRFSENGISYISTNQENGAQASHLLKIEIYDLKKIEKVPLERQWKHADVRLKCYMGDSKLRGIFNGNDKIYYKNILIIWNKPVRY